MTNATQNTNPFDFTNLDDLPEDMQKRLRTETNDNARVYADVVRKGAEAGYDELNINQIMAAASRMGIEVPTQQTVRGYLNSAVEAGMISKPSRQTYGLGKVAPEQAGDVTEAAEPAEEKPAKAPAKGKGKAKAAPAPETDEDDDALADL